MNATSCKSCFRITNQVKLQGDSLRTKTSLQVYNMVKENKAVGILHVAKHDASSVAFLHFSNHVMASVFYNTHHSTGLNIDGLVCTVKATNKNGIVTTYSQVDMARFLPTSRPLTIVQFPESSSQPPESSSQPPESSTQPPESSTQPPESSSQAPEPTSPQPTITTRWKRVFEEGLQLLEDECVTKKARLNELDSRIEEMMKDRQRILIEIEDVEKKKRLAKEIIS